MIIARLKKSFFILIIACAIITNANARVTSPPDFKWGQSYYYDMEIGEKVIFNDVEVTLLKTENHFNLLKIGKDTLELKVARRTLPASIGELRVFVADNKNVKRLSPDTLMHGLFGKDALICLSESKKPMLDVDKYIFPVSFNDGFLWSAGEDSYMFSWQEYDKNIVYQGIGIDLHDAKGLEKHWLRAVENSTVAWISGQLPGNDDNSLCVLLESESQPGIFYVYNKLYRKNISVKKGRKLVRGDIIGTAWGDLLWGNMQFGILKSDTIPQPCDAFSNLINGFPQLYELYFRDNFHHIRSYSKGKIEFGKPAHKCGNSKNTQAFEDYEGKGWQTGKWNIADKVESVANGTDGNVRLRKILFRGTSAECENQFNHYDYEINVPNGVYRVRARAGDIYLSTKQKIEFEGSRPFSLSLSAGEYDWTTERIVDVKDGRLTVRIYIDNKEVAGLSEIVFQKAK